MNKTLLERIARVWLDPLDHADRTNFLLVAALLAVGHILSGIIMGNKVWKKIALFASFLTYVGFLLAYADNYPQLVLIAGIALGAILVATLFSSVFFRGKDDDDNKK